LFSPPFNNAFSGFSNQGAKERFSRPFAP